MVLQIIDEKYQRSSTLDDLVRTYLKHGSEDSLTAIINASEKLIYYFINLYGYGKWRDDLYQVSVEGVLKALERYNPEFGVSFVTYAGHLIIGEIRHYMRKESSYYATNNLKELRYRVEEIIKQQMDETGDIPSFDEIAEKLNVHKGAIKEVMRVGLVSIEEINLSNIRSEVYQSFRLPIEDKIILEQALHKLNGLQRCVIDMLFFKDMTQNQVAETLGIHQRKVSRVLHSGLNKLRNYLTESY